MKIIDSNQDYYDWAGMGIDEAIIYQRGERASVDFEGACGLPQPASFTHNPGYDEETITIIPFYLLVGGFAFPGLELQRQWDFDFTDQEYHLDADAAFAAIANKTRDHDRFAQRELAHRLEEYRAHFSQARRDLTEFCVEHGLVTGCLYRHHMGKRYERDYGPSCRFDPNLLSYYGMADILPPEEAHMMVARFVGGILTENKPLFEISDASKIAKAGFDKQSFRKRKQR